MLDRTKIKKHYVWNGNERPENPEERYLLWTNIDGSCRVVHRNDVQDFIDGKYFETISYNHHGEAVPQPKKRFMTNDEMLKFCVVNINKIVVSYDNHPFNPVGYHSLGCTSDHYRFMYIDQLDKPESEREVHLFEEEE